MMTFLWGLYVLSVVWTSHIMAEIAVDEYRRQRTPVWAQVACEICLVPLVMFWFVSVPLIYYFTYRKK